MTAEPENVTDVFRKVIQHLALYARDTSVGDFDQDSVNYMMVEEALTLIHHPFVCARGHVRVDVRPRIDLASMRQDVTVCPAHTYDNGPTCHMHPCVSAAHLAAWALAGPEAFTSRKPGPGWSSQVFDQWRMMLVHFSAAIAEFDQAQQEAETGKALLNLAKVRRIEAFDYANHHMEAITIKIRPHDSLRRRKKR